MARGSRAPAHLRPPLQSKPRLQRRLPGRRDVARVVAPVIVVAQASYALGPAAFGVLLALSAGEGGGNGEGHELFAADAMAQIAAITCLLAGRRQA